MTKQDSISYRISGELKTGGWTVVYMMHRGATLDQSEEKMRQIVRNHNGSINYTGKFRLEKLTTYISTIETVGGKPDIKYECVNCGEVSADVFGEMCQDCKEREKVCFIKIDKLEADGHSWRCARRQVYGDGECECWKIDRMKEGFTILMLQYTYRGEREPTKNEAMLAYQNDPLVNRLVDCCVKIAIDEVKK